MRPGVTGLWQVTARSVKPMEAGVGIDLEYVQRVSFRLDCMILLATRLRLSRRRVSRARTTRPLDRTCPCQQASATRGRVGGEMRWVVAGGAGFVGAAVCRQLTASAAEVTSLDLHPPPPGVVHQPVDLLADKLCLPPGRVVLAFGRSTPRPVHPWTLALDNAVTTARLAPSLAGRDVTLVSSIEVYGAAGGPLREHTTPVLPASRAALESWVDRALVAAADGPCPPYRVAGLCRDLGQLDPTGRWVYALSKAAQELLVARFVPAERRTVLRLANVVGVGQFRLLARLVETMLGGRPCVITDTIRSFVTLAEAARIIVTLHDPGAFNVSSGSLSLHEVARLVATELGAAADVVVVPAPANDSCGVVDSSRLAGAIGDLGDVRAGLRSAARRLATRPGPMFRPPIAAVVPPRPERPDVVAERIAAALWSGEVRDGRWSRALEDALRARLGLTDAHRLVLTNSGTNALRLAVRAVAGAARPGDVALCPGYTFHATAEVLRQLGWTVRLIDVDSCTWTLDPAAVATALAKDTDVRLVVAVDALGNPCDYAALSAVCAAHEVAFVADSAPSLGARSGGRPVGTQAPAHAFSLSFAKVVSGGGSGGAVVVPSEASLASAENWSRSASMTEASAVVALDGVTALDALLARRRAVAAEYAEALVDVPGLLMQQTTLGATHAYVHWVIRVSGSIGRERLATALRREGVGTKPYYEPLDRSFSAQHLPVTTGLHGEALALPMSSELSLDDAAQVAAGTLRALRTIGSAHTKEVDLRVDLREFAAR